MCSSDLGDKKFCRDKYLSPSKLLQERIAQIRDDESPALREMIKNAQKKISNLDGKLEHSTKVIRQLCEEAQKKIPPKDWDEIIDKIE